MMRVFGIGMVLDAGGENRSPPLPYIEVTESEGKALLKLYPKQVGVYEGGEIVPDPEPEPEPEPEGDEPEGDEPEGDEAEGDEAEGDEAEGDEAETRKQAILDAIELLGADDFVKTGDRKGKPKVDAVAAILEDETTADEIDAALAEPEAE